MAFTKVTNSDWNQIYVKASSFCAYQERTQQEVRHKLYDLGVDKDITEELIARLIQENFINEERFAKAFAGGKFRIKRWGRMKILSELKGKGLSSYCIKKGLEEIGEDDYQNTILNLIEKKEKDEKEKNPLKKKDKIGKYMIRKGYEPELIWGILSTRYR